MALMAGPKRNRTVGRAKVPGEVIEEGVDCPHCPIDRQTHRQDPKKCNHKDARRYQIVTAADGKTTMKMKRGEEKIPEEPKEATPLTTLEGQPVDEGGN